MNCKNDIRKKYLFLRNKLSQVYVEQATMQINLRLEGYIKSIMPKTLGIYCPMKGEINLMSILPFCSQNNITTALPVCDSQKHQINFKTWQFGEPLEAHIKYQFMQPKLGQIIIPEILIVPLITCDRKGSRIGYGGGFYDQYIASSRGLIKKTIGVCYHIMLYNGDLPTDIWDQNLEIIVSEEKTIKKLN